jgi:DNA-binding response OmpR family regulator
MLRIANGADTFIRTTGTEDYWRSDFDHTTMVNTATEGPAARILVVEEEPLIAMMLEDALSDFGYHVVGPAENLKAAVYLAAIENLDAAVVDINIDGEIAEAVAGKLMERSIPFVFIGGRFRKIKLDSGGIPLLQKPFTCDDLHSAIMRLLQGEAVDRM